MGLGCFRIEKVLLLATVVLALGLLLPKPAGASTTFAAAANYPMGAETRSVTSADFDGDGDRDIATAGAGSNHVSVRLNVGDGTFGTFQNYLVGNPSTYNEPMSVTSADLNGDGEIDLAAANNGSGTVGVLLGNGDGTFAAPQTYSLGWASTNRAYSIASADLDGDGDADLAVANPSMGVSLLLGRGDGTFGPADYVPTGEGPCSVVTGDFDGDGDIDLATANQRNTFNVSSVTVSLNNGNGTFGPATLVAQGGSLTAVSAADFDDDGDTDLAASDTSSNDIRIALNEGYATFASSQSYAAGTGPFGLTSADVNGDARADVVVANYSSQGASVLEGNGDGTFAAPQSQAVGGGPLDVASADFDGDAKADIAVANSSSSNVSVLLNTTNRAPLADDDNAATEKDTPAQIDVVANDGDSDGDGLTAQEGAQPSNGNVVCSGTICTYTPAFGFTGTDRFEYTVQDGSGGTDTAVVTVTVSDTIAPAVRGVAPAHRATNVAPTVKVKASFSEAMAPLTLSPATVTLVKKGTTRAIGATVRYDAARKMVVHTPNRALARGVTYIATIKGGTNGARDTSDNVLVRNKSWSFTVRR